MNTKSCFAPAHILLPSEQIPLEKWGCIACDQFTSDRDYWQKAEAAAAGSPSTLNMILPEVYLEDGTMGRAWLTDSGTRQSTAYAVTIGYQLSQYDPATGETTYANVDYTPLTDSTRTLAWLRAHDIKPLLECDSIMYGGDADTQPAINTYETTDSSFGR